MTEARKIEFPVAGRCCSGVVAWLFPASGHLLLGKRFRALGFAVVLLIAFGLGLRLDGNLYRRSPGQPLSYLATLGAMGVGAPYFVAALRRRLPGQARGSGLRIRHRLSALCRPDEPAAGARRLGHRPRQEGRGLSHLGLMTVYAALVGRLLRPALAPRAQGAGAALPADLPRHDGRRHSPRMADVPLPDRARRADSMSSRRPSGGRRGSFRRSTRREDAARAEAPAARPRGPSASVPNSSRAEASSCVADSREISVVGISEALAILPRAREIQDLLVAACEKRRPAVAVLIDFPEFNLRLARKLEWLGIPVVYYISPQVWAWRRGRVRAISELVDRMLVLFSFEVDFYRRHGVPATHVGHPLVDEVRTLAGVWDEPAKARSTRPAANRPDARFAPQRDPRPAAAHARRRRALQRQIEIAPVLIQAPSVSAEFLAPFLARYAAETGEAARGGARGPFRGDRRRRTWCSAPRARRRSRWACWGRRCWCSIGWAPGATCSPAPWCACRTSAWSTWCSRRAAVPELLQGETVPENGRRAGVRAAAVARPRDRDAAGSCRPPAALGRSGASQRAAREVAAYLPERRAPPALWIERRVRSDDGTRRAGRVKLLAFLLTYVRKYWRWAVLALGATVLYAASTVDPDPAPRADLQRGAADRLDRAAGGPRSAHARERRVSGSARGRHRRRRFHGSARRAGPGRRRPPQPPQT